MQPWNPDLPYPPDIDIGYPWGVIQCERAATNIGAYAQVSPTTVHVDDRGDGIEEYWVSVVAVNDDAEYYAEVAVDVGYDKSTNQWMTVVASAYSDPSQWPNGTIHNTYSLGNSSSAPATPAVATYRTSGNTWAFVVNGYQFDTYTYSSSWTPTKISTAMESYNQPAGWTNGQTIVANSDIHYKGTDGVWYFASPSSTWKDPSSFLVTQTTSTTTQTVTSTRYW
ncbi:MAG: hypothetical protein WC325_11395 [Candidatus Bathyarchaeia archaeon]